MNFFKQNVKLHFFFKNIFMLECVMFLLLLFKTTNNEIRYVSKSKTNSSCSHATYITSYVPISLIQCNSVEPCYCVFYHYC